MSFSSYALCDVSPRYTLYLSLSLYISLCTSDTVCYPIASQSPIPSVQHTIQLSFSQNFLLKGFNLYRSLFKETPTCSTNFDLESICFLHLSHIFSVAQILMRRYNDNRIIASYFVPANFLFLFFYCSFSGFPPFRSVQRSCSTLIS